MKKNPNMKEINFNISYSCKHVVCTFSKSCKISIDIEQVIKINLHEFKNKMTVKQWSQILKSSDKTISFSSFG